jgi:hypothetical protein
MKRKIKILFYLFWFLIITPFFGLIPLFDRLGVKINPILYRLDNDILRAAWSLFFGDPAPHITHARPPMSEAQYWAMILVVFLITSLFLGEFLWSWRLEVLRRRSSKAMDFIE